MLISLVEYAKIHNVTPDSVRQKINRGKLQATKIAGVWLIDSDTPYIDNRMRGTGGKRWENKKQ